MREKVEVMGVTREKANLYYIADGAVWKIPREKPGVITGEPTKVAEGGFEMDSDYIYFLDPDGDVSREAKVRPSRRATRPRKAATASVAMVTSGHEVAGGIDVESVTHDEGHGITHGLQIQKFPIDQILAGTKTWEIRGTMTSRRDPSHSLKAVRARGRHLRGGGRRWSSVAGRAADERRTYRVSTRRALL